MSASARKIGKYKVVGQARNVERCRTKKRLTSTEWHAIRIIGAFQAVYGFSHISDTQLADAIGLSGRTVANKLIKRLFDLGIIEKCTKQLSYLKRSRRLRINYEKLKKFMGLSEHVSNIVKALKGRVTSTKRHIELRFTKLRKMPVQIYPAKGQNWGSPCPQFEELAMNQMDPEGCNPNILRILLKLARNFAQIGELTFSRANELIQKLDEEGASCAQISEFRAQIGKMTWSTR